MRFEDALFNWLQIQIVASARPDDRAAANTRDFFLQILTEDHGVEGLGIAAVGEDMIRVDYSLNGVPASKRFARESGEQLLADIEANPKYN